jgi:glutamate synthase domain-containing protein 1
MCGIAGLIHRGKSSNVGSELQGMLQALKHRGEDSTGYALYGDTDGKILSCVLKLEKTLGKEAHLLWKMFLFMMKEKK